MNKYFLGVDTAKPNSKDINAAIVIIKGGNGHFKILDSIRETDPVKFKSQVEQLQLKYSDIKVLNL